MIAASGTNPSKPFDEGRHVNLKSLLYYPNFEIANKTWLKFALLYIDELRPIIPDMPYREEDYLMANEQVKYP